MRENPFSPGFDSGFISPESDFGPGRYLTTSSRNEADLERQPLFGRAQHDPKHEQRLSRLITIHYHDRYLEILNNINLPNSFYQWELPHLFFAWLDLQCLSCYFVLEVLEHAQDKAVTDESQEMRLIIVSLFILAIPNLLFAIIPYYYQMVIEKTKQAVDEEKIIDDKAIIDADNIDAPPPPPNLYDTRHVLIRNGATCLNSTRSMYDSVMRRLGPSLHEFRDFGLIFLPNGLLGMAATIGFCLRMGGKVPFMQSPWFFWPWSMRAFYTYGRLYKVLNGVNADEGVEQHGSFIKAFIATFFGSENRYDKAPDGTRVRKSNATIALMYYVSLGILFSEIYEGKFAGHAFVINLFEGLAVTFPGSAEMLRHQSSKSYAVAFGWSLGALVGIFEGFTNASNAHKGINYLRGMHYLPAFLLFIASVIHTVPAVLGAKEPFDSLREQNPDMMDTARHGDVAYGFGMLFLSSLVLLFPGMVGFGATARDATLEVYREVKAGVIAGAEKTVACAERLAAPVYRCCRFSAKRDDTPLQPSAGDHYVRAKQYQRQSQLSIPTDSLSRSKARAPAFGRQQPSYGATTTQPARALLSVVSGPGAR